MKQVKILINTINKVENFVNIISKFDNNFDMVCGKYVIDAKSIMGLFCLDIREPHTLQIYETTEDNMNDVLDAIQPFIV